MYFPNVLLPLLAATEAARCPHMRRFSLQFCDFLHQNEDCWKIFHIKRNGFSLTVKMKNVFNNVLFLTVAVKMKTVFNNVLFLLKG